MEVSVTNGGSQESIGPSQTFRHFQIISNELATPRILFCPSDTKRRAATNFTSDLDDSRISYFVNLDARTNLVSTQLFGDRNVTLHDTALPPGPHTVCSNDPVGWSGELHKKAGNILLGDFSSQQVTPSGLRRLLEEADQSTNRLLVP